MVAGQDAGERLGGDDLGPNDPAGVPDPQERVADEDVVDALAVDVEAGRDRVGRASPGCTRATVTGDPPRVLEVGRAAVERRERERNRISSLSGSALKSPQRIAGIARGRGSGEPVGAGRGSVGRRPRRSPAPARGGSRPWRGARGEVGREHVQAGGAGVEQLPRHPVHEEDAGPWTTGQPVVVAGLDRPSGEDRGTEAERLIGPEVGGGTARPRTRQVPLLASLAELHRRSTPAVFGSSVDSHTSSRQTTSGSNRSSYVTTSRRRCSQSGSKQRPDVELEHPQHRLRNHRRTLPLPPSPGAERAPTGSVADPLAASFTRRRSGEEAAALLGVGIGRGRSGEGLGLEVLLEALDAVLAADAAGLVAAERHVGAVADAAVDRRSCRCGCAGPRRWPAPSDAGGHAAGQAVLDVVGDAHRVVVVVVGDDHEHRAEDLLLGDGHVVGRRRRSRVGSTNQPLSRWSGRRRPTTRRAPSATPCSM